MINRLPIRFTTGLYCPVVFGCLVAGRRALLAVAIAVVVALTAAPSAAFAATASDRAEAIEIAREQSAGGRVLSVREEQDNNGQRVYAVKIISNGRVKVYRIAAKGSARKSSRAKRK